MKTITLEYQGQPITFTPSETSGTITLCSHWELIDELAQAGLVRREHTQANFGHCEYFIANKP